MKQMLYALLMMSFISSLSVIYATQTASEKQKQDNMREINKVIGFTKNTLAALSAICATYKINIDLFILKRQACVD